VLEDLARQGARSALVVPIGFVCDHTEILFDLDVKARSFASERGLEMGRTESLNTAPAFIRALGDLVRAS
jgi:ferrochelatase